MRRDRHLDAPRRMTDSPFGSLRLRRRWCSWCAAAVLLVAGCTDPAEPQRTIWNATLAAAPGQGPVSGSVGALTRPAQRRTDVSIVISGAPPSATLVWRVRTGPCGLDGTVIGAPVAYPDLETDEVGHDEKAARLSQALDADGTYSVDVRTVDGATLIACGGLVRSEP